MPSEDIIQKTQTKEEQIVRNFYSVLETAGISDDSVFEKARKIVGDHLAVSPQYFDEVLRRLKNKEELTPEMVNIMLYATRDLRPAICTTDSQLPELDEPASKLFTSWDGFRSKVKGYLYSIVRLDRESIGLDFEEKKAFLQKARESNLLHERLNKEIQNRKTLIHCITYDMTDSLAGINKFFSTVNPNKLSPKETQYLEISKRKAQKLEELVQELIDKYTVKEGEANETDSLS